MYAIPQWNNDVQAPLPIQHGKALYNIAGTYLLSVPEDVYLLWVTLCGGGGTGAAAVNTGGTGANFYKVPIKVIPGAQIIIVIGAAGNLSTCSFACCGNLLTAGGGNGNNPGALGTSTDYKGASLATAGRAGLTGINTTAGSLTGNAGNFGAGGESAGAGTGTVGYCEIEW
jgi:hypothetical protein